MKTLVLALIASTLSSLSSGQVEYLPSEFGVSATLESGNIDGQSARSQQRRTSRASRQFADAQGPTSAVAHASAHTSTRASPQNANYYSSSFPATATAVAHATATSVSHPTHSGVVNNRDHYSQTVHSGVVNNGGRNVHYSHQRPPATHCCDACPTYSLECAQTCVHCDGGVRRQPMDHHDRHGPVSHVVSHATSRNGPHGPYTSNGHIRASHRHPSHMLYSTRVCCADCPPGDLDCFSTCQLDDCHSTVKCENSGVGAYAAFCQRECASSLSGFSAMGLDFLPEPACRGVCAAGVQELCRHDACAEFGCVVYDCLLHAPSLCA